MLPFGLVLWLLCYLQVVWGFLILPGFSLLIDGFMLALPLLYWLAVVRFIGDEEKALEERFGDEWRQYSERTPRFLPRL
ncbi:hypothetical protein [Thermococcus sp. ES12]|uniref:methyltransferase family protein n=1 Tax=Thermococcus sp. ES12 TaxID=1638246 RepID=UPI001F116125|nr:hypothetical protein [Thermococcus sp. ES12]